MVRRLKPAQRPRVVHRPWRWRCSPPPCTTTPFGESAAAVGARPCSLHNPDAAWAPIMAAWRSRPVLSLMGAPRDPIFGGVGFNAPAALHAKPRAAGVAPGLAPDGCRPRGHREDWRTPRRSRPGWVLVLRAILARLGAAHCRGVARRRWGLGSRGGDAEQGLEGISATVGPRSSHPR